MIESRDRNSATAGLVAALQRAWDGIQSRHPDVPDVVLTIGSGSLGLCSGRPRLGHLAADRWQRADHTRVPELFVGDALRGGAVAVLTTLLHEAAHGMAHTGRIKDTSQKGRHHNARYKTLATELGLVVNKARTLGWSTTQLPPTTAQHYTRELADIKRALIAYRHPETRRDDAADSHPDTVARCRCDRRIRISRTVLDLGPITCGTCGSHFDETHPGTPPNRTDPDCQFLSGSEVADGTRHDEQRVA